MEKIRIMGIDPGSRHTGFGLVDHVGSRIRYLASGTVRVPTARPFPERLGYIYSEIRRVIETFQPDELAIEDVFFAKNVRSALRLGQARGVAIAAGVNAGLPVTEYTALQIKRAVVGYGKATKIQVAEMIRVLLAMNEPMSSHAADALAVAICHAHTRSSRITWQGMQT